eukprot:gnl/TRDRNA2_/TRDRNA2_131424_c0_seq1.p1 gnl/TRDRNA2_/TRDRNA2_131424_c0~~gnl/TRDRNA2_/TRDRNA2_131424_c0_seq1.p1  ORF type:complete len:783 (-),score=146.58 gnl/TRDRNA2_/TRDRNA2_131424_c0_seq1:47-2395(-)
MSATARPSLREYDARQFKAHLRQRFPTGPEWLEPLLADRIAVTTLMFSAIAELSVEEAPAESAGDVSGHPRVSSADKAVASQSKTVASQSKNESTVAVSSSTRQVVGRDAPQPTQLELRSPAASTSAALAALLADTGPCTELLVRVPWAEFPSFASASRSTALAVREANWQRLVEALADESGLLVPRLLQGHPAAPASSEGWRAYFAELWRSDRHKWRDSGAGASAENDGFRVRALARFRPGEVGGGARSQLFLPLHQRLQLVKLGHDDEFRQEVARRLASASAFVSSAEGDGAQEVAASAACDADEESRCQARVISTEDKRVLASLPGMGLRYFEFDRVLDGRHGQGEVYRTAALPAVEALLRGFSSCVLCYGQTGSGKTHTMFGAQGVLDTVATEASLQETDAGDTGGRGGRISCPARCADHQAGMAPRAVADVLSATMARAQSVSATVTLQYVEIYNDKLTDLLSGEAVTLFRIGQGQAASEYREASTCELGEELYQLQGATTAEVRSPAEALQALAEAEVRKHRAATALNARSSRAHVVLMLGLIQRFGGQVLRSRLFLVDLGGSEQVKKSRAEGARFTEAVEINSSLLVLGRVVDALVQGRSHVPYYESKLTMLLQPALGGNALTTVVITASPEGAHGDETVHALRFGERCAHVTNDARASTAPMAEVLASLDASIAACEKEVASLRARGAEERADAELRDGQLRGLGRGFDRSRLAARSHDDGTSGKEAALTAKGAHETTSSSATYTVVEDLAGAWIMEQERLRALQERRREIVGI